MGWSDDDIDNLYKNAVDSQKYDYQEVYWNEMEALLNQEKAGKKRVIWWIPTIILLLIGLGFGTLVLIKQEGVGENITEIAPLSKNMSDVDQSNFDELNHLTNTESNTYSIKKDKENIKNVNSNSVVDNSQYFGIQSQNTNHFLMIKSQQNESISVGKSNDSDRQMDLMVKDQNVNETDLDTLVVQANQTDEYLVEVDSISATNSLQLGFEDPISSKRGFFYSGVFAGAGSSYIKGGSKPNVEFGFKLGYEYQLSSNFKFGGGLGYRFQVADDVIAKTTQTYYGLKAFKMTQTSIYDQFQFVDVNLHLHYSIRKFAFGVQLTPTYLFAQRSKQIVETKEEIEFNRYEYNPEFVQSKNFNSFGMDAGMSLQYAFKRDVLIELTILSRVTSIMGNAQFEGAERKFPVKVGIGITKRF